MAQRTDTVLVVLQFGADGIPHLRFNAQVSCWRTPRRCCCASRRCAACSAEAADGCRNCSKRVKMWRPPAFFLSFGALQAASAFYFTTPQPGQCPDHFPAGTHGVHWRHQVGMGECPSKRRP
jgi:hypothetical protein